MSSRPDSTPRRSGRGPRNGPGLGSGSIDISSSWVGCVPHLVSDDVDALLFAWSDVAALSRAVRRIIENPTGAAVMGRAGHAKASSKFTWEILGPRVETIYEAAVRS